MSRKYALRSSGQTWTGTDKQGQERDKEQTKRQRTD